MSTWFAFERWIFNWHNGNKLLSDVLAEAARIVLNIRIVAWAVDQYQRTVVLNKRVARKGAPIYNAFRNALAMFKLSLGSSTASEATSVIGETVAASSFPMEQHPPPDIEAQNVPGGPDSPRPLDGKERFVHLVRRVIAVERAAGNMRPKQSAIRPVMRSTRRHFTGMSDLSATVPSGIISTLVPRLQNLDVVQKLDVHTALVRDLQFSPDGQLLATTGYVQYLSLVDRR